LRRSVAELAFAISLLGSAVARADAPLGDALAGVSTEQAPESLRFHGFTFDVTVGDGSGLNAVGQNYRNELAFYFEPKWNVGARFLADTRFKGLQLTGRFTLTQSLHGTDEAGFGAIANSGPQGTCSNLITSSNGGQVDPGSVGYCNPSANNRRLDYSDVWLTIRDPDIYRIPKIGVGISPSLRFILPTSAESQYQTLNLALVPTVSFGRGFWNDRIHASYAFSFTKNFHRYSTPQQQADSSGNVTPPDPNAYDGLQGVGLSNFYTDPSRVGTIAGVNTSYSWINALDASLDIIPNRLSLDVLYLYIQATPYGQSCSVNVNGTVVNTCQSGDAVASASGSSLARPGHHDFEVFWATLSYKAKDWLSFYLAWINWAPAQFPDSSLRQPFVSTNYDAFTTVQAGITVSVEKVAAVRF
jgi:hypothetical protein